MKRQSLRFMAATLVLLVVSSGVGMAQETSPESAGEDHGIINQTCPVSPDEDVDPRFTAEYKGQTIGLCCRKCRRKFEKDPEAYVANLPQFRKIAAVQIAKGSDNENTPEQDSDHAESQDKNTDHVHQENDSHEETDMARDKQGATNHASGEHDHAKDHDSNSPRLISWLGKFHPPTTHIPIGMLLGAALAEGLFMVTKRELFRHAAIFCVWIATIGAMVVVTLGWFNGGFVLVDDDWVQTSHRWLGTGTAIMTLVTLGLMIRYIKSNYAAKAMMKYRIALFATAGLISLTGFFGGALVYGIDHYAW